MAFVGGGLDSDISPGAQRQSGLGDEVACYNPQVLSGRYVQITASRDAGTVLGDGLIPISVTQPVAIGLLGSRNLQIPGSAQGGVVTALQRAARVVEIAPGTHAQVMTRLDPRRAVDEIPLLSLVARAAGMTGDSPLVGHIPRKRNNADIPARNNPTRPVSQIITRQRIQPIPRLQQPTVHQAVVSPGNQIIGRPQRPGVVQVLTGNQRDVAALDQRSIRRQPMGGVRQVKHRHQHLLAVHRLVFHPDDVVGQRRDLFAGQAYAQGQVEGVLAGDGVVHQVLEHAFIGGLAIEETLAGAGDDGLLDQALFVEAVAQALGGVVRVVAQVGQQVIRAHEPAHVGQRRVGFDQVFLRVGLERAVRQAAHLGQAAALGRGAGAFVQAEQAVLTGGQVETGQGHRVDLLLGEVGRELLVDGDAG
ncbi:hypothetical protein BN844_3844 [Pseudomonas sp. SHC52]|nr:hypothetical protein BN844_3844 [Pseudomonas sp. SHC52]